MIIMSVDYGDVRTGIAVCDKFEMLATPVCAITQRKRELLIEEIKSLAEKHKAEIEKRNSMTLKEAVNELTQILEN